MSSTEYVIVHQFTEALETEEHEEHALSIVEALVCDFLISEHFRSHGVSSIEVVLNDTEYEVLNINKDLLTHAVVDVGIRGYQKVNGRCNFKMLQNTLLTKLKYTPKCNTEILYLDIWVDDPNTIIIVFVD